MPPPPSLDELEFKYFLARGVGGGIPYSGETVVIPHVDGESYFGAIADALDQCEGPGDRIYIASWYLNPSMPLRTSAGSELLQEILLKKAEKGADLRIIVATPRFSIGPVGTNPAKVEWWLGAMGGKALSQFTHQNIRAVMNLRHGLGITTHRIDGRVLMDWGGRNDARHEKSTIIYSLKTKELRAFIGGMDYAPDRMANELHTTLAPLPWHDVGVELRGGAAMAVLENFQTRWTETATLPSQHYWIDDSKWVFNTFIEHPPPSQPTNLAQPVVSAGAYAGSSVRILRSYEGIRAFSPWLNRKDLPWNTLPPTGIREILSALQQAILEATNYIYVEDQTLNRGIIEGAYIKHHLLYPTISVALARGVKVIFVSQGKSGPSEMPVSFTMSNQIRDEILAPRTPAERENFALYLITDTKVHSKVVLVDDEFASIGSANFWDRSMDGTESELNAAIVHPGGQNSLIADLRVRLWRGHLRVASSASVDAELRDLRKSMGMWRTTWGWGITFPHPNSALKEITP